jgi:hypothetical protein
VEALVLRSPLECFRFSSVNGLSHMASASTLRSIGESKRTGGRLNIHNRSCPPLILTLGGQICWESDRHPMILKARLISNYCERLSFRLAGLLFNTTCLAFFLREGRFLIYGARSLTLELPEIN